MLHTINLDNSLAAMVEAMLPLFSPANLGLVIQLDLRASNNETDKSVANLITFIFQRPSNYTKVLVKRTEFRCDPWLLKGQEIVMELASDHDSCWRSDGFRILNEDWQDKVDKVGHPYGKAYIHFWNSFSIFESIKYVKFKEFKVDRDERNVKFIVEEFLTTEELWSRLKVMLDHNHN